MRCLFVCYCWSVYVSVAYFSEGKHQKLRHEFHFTIAMGTCTSMCTSRSNRMRGEHISRRLSVSVTCSMRVATRCFKRVVSGRPSALKCVVRHSQRDSLNDAKACCWGAVVGPSNIPANTYDIAPFESRMKSTALSLKALVMTFMFGAIQFCSPPRSLLRRSMVLC